MLSDLPEVFKCGRFGRKQSLLFCMCSHIEQVAAYRSPNPFQTETPFAKWLMEEKENRPEKFAFWSKLYPICYSRTVEESASLF